MLEGTETVIDPTPAGTTVTTTATVDSPVTQDTFDRVPVEITFQCGDDETWTRHFKKGERARILLGLWDDHGPFRPIEAGTPDEIVAAGRKAQAAYWYAMKSDSLGEVADALNISRSTVSIYASQVRWTIS